MSFGLFTIELLVVAPMIGLTSDDFCQRLRFFDLFRLIWSFVFGYVVAVVVLVLDMLLDYRSKKEKEASVETAQREKLSFCKKNFRDFSLMAIYFSKAVVFVAKSKYASERSSC